MKENKLFLSESWFIIDHDYCGGGTETCDSLKCGCREFYILFRSLMLIKLKLCQRQYHFF